MPFYDFRCHDCGRFSRLRFSYSEYGKVQAVCPDCSSRAMRRRMSRVALGKSEDARLETMMDGDDLSGFDESDPRSLGKFMRKMGQEMGEDLGDEFNEVVGRLEKGELPESIEQSMPDLVDGNETMNNETMNNEQ